jgi:hypothetical protein
MSRRKRLLIILGVIFFVSCNKSIVSLLSCKRTYKPLTDKRFKRCAITKIVEGELTYYGFACKKTFYTDCGFILTTEKPSPLNVGDSIDIMMKK